MSARILVAGLLSLVTLTGWAWAGCLVDEAPFACYTFEGMETLTAVNAVFSKRPADAPLKRALKSCLKAAIALNPSRDMLATAFVGDDAISFPGGVYGLKYEAKSRAISDFVPSWERKAKGAPSK